MYRALLVALILLVTSPAHPAVFTVGPGGTHSTLQGALNAAVANGEDDEIRIRQGMVQTTASAVHAENFRLEITGGWAAGFGSAVADPSATVLTGSQLVQVLSLDIPAGDVLIRNLTLADGVADSGGGAHITVSNANFELAECRVIANTATGSTNVFGGGVRLVVDDDASAEIDRCLFANNNANSASAAGGGLSIAADDGSFVGRRLEFINNAAVGTATARGGGLSVDVGGIAPSVEFVRLTVRSNRVESNSASLGAGMHVRGSASLSGPFVEVEAAEFERNRRDGSAAGAAQLQLDAPDGNFTLRSVAALDGINVSGLRIDATAAAQFLTNNTTAAGNDADGIRHEDGSSNTQTQYNAIAFGNGGADLVVGDDGNGSVLTFGNLSGADPGVVDAANGNYRLASGSSAIDSCISSPAGGLGTLDADFGDRVVNGFVDCGAYEWSADNEDVVFGDGFEAL